MKILITKAPDSIVVEKQEQIMGDFNGDGMPVLMGVNTGSHDSGNDQQLYSVPNGSFVFSDTKSLKIKDPQILEMFGSKKPATPAQLAKQYDLQKYKKILDDPDKDAVDKNTAKIMYENYVNKLNTLASVQEDMKKQQDEARQQSAHMRYGGYTPEYPWGGPYVNSPYQPAPITGFPYIPATGNTQPTSPKPATGTGKKKTGVSRKPGMPKGQSSAPYDNSGQPFGMMAPPDAAAPYIPGIDNIGMYNNGPLEYTNVDPGMQQAPGAPQMAPVSAVPLTAVIKEKERQNSGAPRRNPFNNPDVYAAAVTGLRAGQYPAYNPIRQVAHGAYAQPVYMDPTRAKAAVQEAANSAANAIAMSANGPVARANTLALYGKTAPQVANIEAEYAQKNAELATRTNEQAAGLYNQLWQQQQNYNKEYVEDTHNAQMDKLGYQFGVQNELLKQAYQAENRKRTAQNYNYVNPYYTMDSRGYIYPKGDEQLRALQGITGPNTGSGKAHNPFDVDAIAKTMNITDPDTIKEMRKKAGLMYMQQMLGPKMSQSSGDTRYSGYDYEGDRDLTKRRGGTIKKKTKVRITGIPSK